jgi:hypothetical protein
MQNRGLIFIPDISGFTKFISETEIEHSRMIIQELLEIIINSNRMGLEISEIEGDAVLFYKFGEPPALQEVYKQVEEMFVAFHRSLIAYDHHKYCHCKACLSVVNLTLKVITHYGEFTGYQVKNFNKLIGKDIIVAHQLLKNDIDNHEYWLVTHNLLQQEKPEVMKSWMNWESSVKETENGTVPFQYTKLEKLRNEIPPESVPQLTLQEKVKVLSFTEDYDTDIITLFHASGDFSYRPQWWSGIKEVKDVNHMLPRVGMKCRFVLGGDEVVTIASSYSFTPEHIEFSETDEQKERATYFTLDKLGEKKARLTLDYYLKKSATTQLLFSLTQKRKMKETFQTSMKKLHDLVQEIKLPDA